MILIRDKPEEKCVRIWKEKVREGTVSFGWPGWASFRRLYLAKGSNPPGTQ